MFINLPILINSIFAFSGLLFIIWLYFLYYSFFKRDEHFHEDNIGINKRTSRSMYLNCGKHHL